LLFGRNWTSIAWKEELPLNKGWCGGTGSAVDCRGREGNDELGSLDDVSQGRAFSSESDESQDSQTVETDLLLSKKV
jgi:hypothetical protein